MVSLAVLSFEFIRPCLLSSVLSFEFLACCFLHYFIVRFLLRFILRTLPVFVLLPPLIFCSALISFSCSLLIFLPVCVSSQRAPLCLCQFCHVTHCAFVSSLPFVLFPFLLSGPLSLFRFLGFDLASALLDFVCLFQLISIFWPLPASTSSQLLV